MNGYRVGTVCEFCDESAEVLCPRCQCHVCARHRPGNLGFCALCAKEARDDADVARFQGAVHQVDQPTGAFGRGGTAPLVEMFVGWLGRVVLNRAASAAEPEVPFARRTPEQIRAWRKRSGVRTRT